MIHRPNYLDVCAYLHHNERVRQHDPQTLKHARLYLRHLLEWADDSPFARARQIDPTFPAYLATTRVDGQERTRAPLSIAKGLAIVRQFFTFARAEWPTRYKAISESWIELLRPPRSARLESRLPVRQFWTLDDALKVAAVSTETLREERGKVAVCMLFLSGMRADALATIPIHCVDLAHQAIHQLPEFGVRTKNDKAAITYLLQIPQLFEVVQSWHARLLCAGLPPSALWYATLTRDGMTLTATEQAFEGRHDIIRKDIKLICKQASVPYLSSHKLRHGHTVYALKRAKDMGQLKAISQNIMHKSVVTTDQIYGNLLHDDVQQIITGL